MKLLLSAFQIRMLPLKIYTRKKIFNYYSGLSFFIFIWIIRQPHDESRLVRHEKIHFLQQVEMLFVFHWLVYALFYLLGRLNGQNHYIAYRYNPFELEAYTHEHDPAYLVNRRTFGWMPHVKECVRGLRANRLRAIPDGKRITWHRWPRPKAVQETGACTPPFQGRTSS